MCELPYERYLLLFDYNFLPIPDTMVDPAEVTGPNHCYKFVNHRYNTRLLISYDPQKNEP